MSTNSTAPVIFSIKSRLSNMQRAIMSRSNSSTSSNPATLSRQNCMIISLSPMISPMKRSSLFLKRVMVWSKMPAISSSLFPGGTIRKSTFGHSCSKRIILSPPIRLIFFPIMMWLSPKRCMGGVGKGQLKKFCYTSENKLFTAPSEYLNFWKNEKR